MQCSPLLTSLLHFHKVYINCFSSHDALSSHPLHVRQLTSNICTAHCHAACWFRNRSSTRCSTTCACCCPPTFSFFLPSPTHPHSCQTVCLTLFDAIILIRIPFLLIFSKTNTTCSFSGSAVASHSGLEILTFCQRRFVTLEHPCAPLSTLEHHP